MAALHLALQSLGPSDFSSVPTEESKTKEYLQHLFAQAQTIVDSVPIAAEDISTPSTPARSRSNTAITSPSGASDLTTSSARSDLINPANILLQKEWGKPIKLGTKENPMGMSVYKMAGKDSRGAWFARRSVHEGLGFRKWKLGLQREFPESMEVQGSPGEGNIRGIGAERKLEKLEVNGVGAIEVYHLSAQFPGPTTPRDFVEMLVTSSAALDRSNSPSPSRPSTDSRFQDTAASNLSTSPRHFMVISKPCIHLECPPRNGFIRGHYESVEFIREIPTKPTTSSSTTDLRKLQHSNTAPLPEQAALVRSAQQTLDRGGSGEEMLASMDTDGHVPEAKDILVQEGRKRGKTISFAESRGDQAKGEVMDKPHDETDGPTEQNPVEWIMITRSDPGGSVPRFMVERGTPAGIVSDASKFLDWACVKKHPVKHDYSEQAPAVDKEIEKQNTQAEGLEQDQANDHLEGLEDVPQSTESSMTLTDETVTVGEDVISGTAPQSSVTSSLTNAAYAGIESYAPQYVIDRLPGHQKEPVDSLSQSNDPTPLASDPTMDEARRKVSIASTSDAASFASAEEAFDDASSSESHKSAKSTTPASSPSATRQDRELAKLQQRKKVLDDQLARTREKETKDKDELTSKEEDRIRRAEEKHRRETSKQELRYQKEVAKIEAKRVKDEHKDAEKKKKMEERDDKVRLTRERDVARSEVDGLKKEREGLREQVGALQRENTALVARVGKLEVGKQVLGDVKKEIESVERRERSGSLRGKKGDGVEATVLA
ncbi:MAG: hypothetical protein Q9186_001598 [Xanthomendoza sp. 1 TL-2023]